MCSACEFPYLSLCEWPTAVVTLGVLLRARSRVKPGGHLDRYPASVLPVIPSDATTRYRKRGPQDRVVYMKPTDSR